MGASCVRWTADTERAFLFALRLEGQVLKAAAAIGRAPSVCYARRQRVPAFAAAWDAALAAMEGERLAAVAATRNADGEVRERPLTRIRRDGWTRQRQRLFCRALADTGSYAAAASETGLSLEGARRFRRRSPEFRTMCEQALTEGGTTLAETARARAVEGWEEPVYHGGQVVGYRRRFSDRLLSQLLRDERLTEKRRGPVVTREQTDASILRKLRAMSRAKAREGGERPEEGEEERYGG